MSGPKLICQVGNEFIDPALVGARTPLRRSRAFQNSFARTRDAFRHWRSAHEKGAGRHRCVRRGKCRTMKIYLLETEWTRFPHLILATSVQLQWSQRHLLKDSVGVCGPRKMVRLSQRNGGLEPKSWFVRQKVLGAHIHTFQEAWSDLNNFKFKFEQGCWQVMRSTLGDEHCKNHVWFTEL